MLEQEDKKMKKYEEPVVSMLMLSTNDCLMASGEVDPYGEDKVWY